MYIYKYPVGEEIIKKKKTNETEMRKAPMQSHFHMLSKFVFFGTAMLA